MLNIKLQLKCSRKNDVVNSDNLLFLEKYDLNVISLDENNTNYERNLALFKSYLRQETIKYLYIYENAPLTEEVKQTVEDNSVETLDIKNLKNITDEERDQNEDYFTIMYNNLEEIKKELYKNS